MGLALHFSCLELLGCRQGRMEDSEVSIRIELKSGRRFPLVVAFSHSATCNDILETIKSCLLEIDMISSGSQWILMESWHGISKQIKPQTELQCLPL